MLFDHNSESDQRETRLKKLENWRRELPEFYRCPAKKLLAASTSFSYDTATAITYTPTATTTNSI
jgi:hypothetical protein